MEIRIIEVLLYLVEKMLPVVQDEVMSWVKSEIEGETHFSFTTDA